MIDPASLGDWIQPQHLSKDALHAYHEIFISDPARLVVLKRFLLDSVAEKLAQFLTAEAEFRTVYGLYSNGNGDTRCATEEEWLKAKEQDRFYRFGQLAGARSGFEFSANLLMFLKFRKAFVDPEFKAFFEEVTGLALGCSHNSNVSSMKSGDFLRSHDDAVGKRSLAIVLYLSPHWDPSWGGALHMTDGRGKQIRMEAEFNTITLFDVTAGTNHFVAPIESAAGEKTRATIGGWIHRPTVSSEVR